jgi:hypothetical protein
MLESSSKPFGDISTLLVVSVDVDGGSWFRTASSMFSALLLAGPRLEAMVVEERGGVGRITQRKPVVPPFKTSMNPDSILLRDDEVKLNLYVPGEALCGVTRIRIHGHTAVNK